jgi:hypothetical protein
MAVNYRRGSLFFNVKAGLVNPNRQFFFPGKGYHVSDEMTIEFIAGVAP